MKKKICIILCLVWILSLVGCSNAEKGTETNIFYVNPDGNALIQDEYYRKETSGEESVKEVLKVLQSPTDEKKFQSAIPKKVEIEKCYLEDKQLELVFNEEYSKISKSAEVLLRAAVVQTLVQLPDVTFVAFYVEDEPLRDLSGDIIGLMCAEDFIQNTGYSLKLYQEKDLKLYFVNKDGTKLGAEKRTNVHYNINTSVEKLVVEQLMKGTSAEKRSGTIPSSVKLLGVSVKDGICYVNFDSAFLNDGYNIKPEVAIYSIVNSIIANGNATKVQILVDGSGDVMFMGTVDLSEPLGWKADVIEE